MTARTGVAIIVFCGLSVCVTSAQQEFGTAEISGHVLDNNDKPVADASVRIFPLQVAWSGPMPVANTDRDGMYRLVVPSVGMTRICAKKENLGYPDTTAAIFLSGAEKEPEIDLKAGAKLQNVDLHLGQPDGNVELFVKDEKTGAAISNARITMRRKEDPEVMYSSGIPDGIFATVLPWRPITITISAPGYRKWSYVDSATGHDFVEVGAYRRMKIDVEMSPSGPSQ